MRTSLTRFEPAVYAVLRIVAGFMFLFHGFPKLVGWFSERPMPAVGSQLWIGGVIELVAGALIMLGAFTRYAAVIASGTMAVAFFQFHAVKNGHILPIVNGGDAAALYCFVFLFIAVRGAGVWSVDSKLGRD